MKKDLFIDNNVASKFSNPQDKEYIKLTSWLMMYDNKKGNKDDYAHLVVSQKLLVEYYRSAQGAKSDTAIPMIIAKLQQQGRLVIKTNQEIKDFKSFHFTKAVEKSLRSNKEDREHIPVVLLSERKYAISYDENFTFDVVNFSGFKAKVEKRPEDINYAG